MFCPTGVLRGSELGDPNFRSVNCIDILFFTSTPFGVMVDVLPAPQALRRALLVILFERSHFRSSLFGFRAVQHCR